MFDSVAAYMDAARGNHGLRSDRALALKLKLTQQTLFSWRKGTCVPSDGQMKKLAELAGADATEALLLLNVWRAKDEAARDAYWRLLQRLYPSAGAVIIAASLACLSPARAESRETVPSRDDKPALYIMGNFRRLRGRVAAALSRISRRLAPFGRPRPAPLAA